eukprot:1711977-Prymnesium_polylepis.1
MRLPRMPSDDPTDSAIVWRAALSADAGSGTPGNAMVCRDVSGISLGGAAVSTAWQQRNASWAGESVVSCLVGSGATTPRVPF